MIRSLYVVVLVAMAGGSASLQAQARPQPQDPKPAVPRTHLPPPGMCRIWLDNVPPSQQPAPTDCASAVRRASNGVASGSSTMKSASDPGRNVPTEIGRAHV